MNTEGRSLLTKLGFQAPFGEIMLRHDEVTSIDLDRVYAGSRCGISIQAGSSEVRLSDGPNGVVGKLPGIHNIPRKNFWRELEKVVELTGKMSIPHHQQVYAFCHSVPADVSVSGICAKVDDRGFGYLACELVEGVRRGDFTPDAGICDKVVGGRRMAHSRTLTDHTGLFSDEWIQRWTMDFMRKINQFEEGVIGLEFVFDRTLRQPICYDFYWSPVVSNRLLLEKFHLEGLV